MDDIDEVIKTTARNLRKRQTESEKVFWDVVRNRKLNGKKFLRQHPVVFNYNGQKRFFISDFYCKEYNLVVELDGSIHQTQKDYDELRDYLLGARGLKVLRFTNNDIESDLEGVIEKIRSFF